MTRDEFYEEITDWWELKDFCDNESLSTLDCIYDEYDFDEHIDDALDNVVRFGGEGWYDIKDMLNEVPTGHRFYYVDPDDAWNCWGVDDDFEDWKQDVINAMDDLGLWEIEDDDDEEEVDPDDLIPVADEPIAFDDFMNASLVALDTARTNKQMAVVATSEFLVVEATA